MDLLNLFVRIGVNDEASGQLEGISSSAIAKATVMGQAMYDALKFGVSKIADVTQTLVNGALEGYGAYEQLTGGMKKLYGDASDTVIADARRAYKEVGISANKYMESVAGFSAALMNSVKGDSQEAARLSNMAMKDIADNANTFGKYTVDELTEVYQALAKGNYQTLDNLNLGFGGTKEGMQKLIDKANELRAAQGETSKLTIDSYADIVTAIHTVQEEMNITGTTEKEAMFTIEGSINSVKAAWENLLTSIGSGDPEMIQESVTGIVDGIFGTFNEELGKREGGVINNVLPVIQNVGSAIANEMPAIAQQISDEFSAAMQDTFGIDMSWMDTFTTELKEKVDSIVSAAEDLANGFNAAFDVQQAQESLEGIVNTADRIWQLIDNTILANGGEIGGVIATIANALTSVSTLLEPLANVVLPILEGALSAIGSVLEPLITFVTTFYETAAEQLKPALEGLQPVAETVSQVLGTIGDILGSILTPAAEVLGTALGLLVSGPLTLLSEILSSINEYLQPFIDFFTGLPTTLEGSFEQLETDMTKLSDGLKAGWDDLLGKGREVWEGIKSAIGDNVLETKDKVLNAFGEIKAGVEEKWNAVVEWVTGIPQRITDALGDLGDLLWGAGTSIIDGLLGGMKEMADDMFGWVGSIADNIANLKGPLPYDRKVLVKNGRALMTGLKDGIEQGFEKDVKPTVKSLAKGIDTYYGTISDNRDYVSAIAYFKPSSSSGGNRLYSAAVRNTVSSQSGRRSSGSSKLPNSTFQYVRDEGAITMLKAIYAKMRDEPELNTRKLAKMLAPDMNRELGRL